MNLETLGAFMTPLRLFDLLKYVNIEITFYIIDSLFVHNVGVFVSVKEQKVVL